MNQLEQEIQDRLLFALRVAQTNYIHLSKDELIYQRIKDAWRTVSIALAEAEAA